MRGEYESQLPNRPIVELIAPLAWRIKRSGRAQIVGRVIIAILAICIDNLLVPSAQFERPFTALGFFAILILVSNRSPADRHCLPRLSAARLAAFACLHLLFLISTYHFAPVLRLSQQSYTIAASLVSFSRTVVLLPTLVLFNDSEFFKRYAAELTATAIVFLTLFPDRFFRFIWPCYSRVLTRASSRVCGFLLPGTYLSAAAGGYTLVGPSVNMIIGFECSGITGINLFHLVFGIVVICEWNRLNKVRALICYFLGSIAYLIANFFRLIALFLLANLHPRHWDFDVFSWVLFGFTFYILMKIGYEWMITPQHRIAASRLDGLDGPVGSVSDVTRVG